MSCAMPEIGSLISLISKAGIRYEGSLFTVDPDRCTIALARVKSYGTEDRETQYPIAPQSQCYDYILFRGSDIQDIRVINNCSMPADPAIMQMGPPQKPPMTQPMYQQPGFMGLGGPMAGPPPMGQYNQFGGMNNLGASVLDMIGGSRSTTPSNLLSRKSPTTDMGVQTNQSQNSSRDNNRSGDSGNSGRGNNDQRNNQQRPNNQQRNNNNQQQRERRDSGKMGDQNKQYHQQRQGGNNMNNMQNRGWNNHRNNQNNHHNNQQNQMRGTGDQAGAQQGWRGRSRPRNGPVQPQQGATNRSKNTLKFDNDYDFEQANNKFEELRSQLTKLKVGDEPKPEQVVENIDKKDDSGNETGAGDHEQEDDEIYYDKTKSFFDQISCEAVERQKGKSHRTDWRQERKLNTETFGVGSTRRGGFRGRGGYYNRGGPNNYRGNNNYRGGNNYRGRSGNRPNNMGNQSNGLPQRSNQQQSQTPQPAVVEVAAGK